MFLFMGLVTVSLAVSISVPHSSVLKLLPAVGSRNNCTLSCFCLFVSVFATFHSTYNIGF